MERMINKRLVWFLETNHIFRYIQSCLRKNTSTIDPIVRLETFVRDAFGNKEHAVSVVYFFLFRKSILYHLEKQYIERSP